MNSLNSSIKRWSVFLFVVLAGLLVFGSSVSSAQTANPCDSNDPGPFVVTSARAYTVTWCTAKTNTASDGTTVPEIIDGFYISVDGAQRADIGKPTLIGTSTVTQRDAWTWSAPSGVSKGSHTMTVVAYNFTRDDNGNPTTTRQESTPVTAPFSAVDPVYNVPPKPVTGLRIAR